MVTANGHSYWSQLMVTAIGHCYWSQLLVTVFGHSYWSQLLVTATGHSIWIFPPKLNSGRASGASDYWILILCPLKIVIARLSASHSKNEMFNERHKIKKQIILFSLRANMGSWVDLGWPMILSDFITHFNHIWFWVDWIFLGIPLPQCLVSLGRRGETSEGPSLTSRWSPFSQGLLTSFLYIFMLMKFSSISVPVGCEMV